MMNSSCDESAIAGRALVVGRSGSEILHGLDFSCPPGSITGLLGPSGCGKSTLMRTIMGVQKISAGELTVLGHSAGSANLRHRVAYTSQSLSIYPDISIRANVAYFARLIGAGEGAVDDALEQVQLADIASRRVDSLSGGQASRASLACALVGSPEVLVLDEPTVGLDPLTRESLWTTFRQLADAGRTLLISSHVMDEASRCDSVLFMRAGRFLAHDSVAAVQQRTGTDSPEAAFLALIQEGSAA